MKESPSQAHIHLMGEIEHNAVETACWVSASFSRSSSSIELVIFAGGDLHIAFDLNQASDLSSWFTCGASGAGNEIVSHTSRDSLQFLEDSNGLLLNCLNAWDDDEITVRVSEFERKLLSKTFAAISRSASKERFPAALFILEFDWKRFFDSLVDVFQRYRYDQTNGNEFVSKLSNAELYEILYISDWRRSWSNDFGDFDQLCEFLIVATKRLKEDRDLNVLAQLMEVTSEVLHWETSQTFLRPPSPSDRDCLATLQAFIALCEFCTIQKNVDENLLK